MEENTYVNEGKHWGIAKIKENYCSQAEYHIYEDKGDPKDIFFEDPTDGKKNFHLGYLIACGPTKEKALMSAIENLIEEKRKILQILRRITSEKDHISGERIVSDKDKIPSYDVDPNYLP